MMNYACGTNDRVFERMIKAVEQERGENIDPAVKDAVRAGLIDPSEYTLQIPKERTFMMLDGAPKLTQLLYQMNWSLVRPLHGFFVTSDNPVVRWVDPTSRHPVLGDDGFLNKTAEVSFPLTPKLQLLMAWSELPKDGLLEREVVLSANKMRASHADKYLFAHLCNKDLKQLATTFKDSRPRLMTSGSGPDKFGAIEVPRRRTKPSGRNDPRRTERQRKTTI